MYWHVNQDLPSLLHISSYPLNLGVTAKNLSCKRRQCIAFIFHINWGNFAKKSPQTNKTFTRKHPICQWCCNIEKCNVGHTCQMFLQQCVNWGKIMFWSLSSFHSTKLFILSPFSKGFGDFEEKNISTTLFYTFPLNFITTWRRIILPRLQAVIVLFCVCCLDQDSF